MALLAWFKKMVEGTMFAQPYDTIIEIIWSGHSLLNLFGLSQMQHPDYIKKNICKNLLIYLSYLEVFFLNHNQ